MKKLSIIIPVYNEEESVNKLLNLVKNVKLSIEKEIIVVDDCSKDNSLELLKKIDGIKLVGHNVNRGKGAAIRTGLKHSTGDIVIIQDADLEYDPNQIPNLVQPILDRKTDVVYGSRRLQKSNKQYSSYSFYCGGVLLTLVANLLYGLKITDEATCYKVFKADVLHKITLKCTRFEFCPEVTAKVAKKKINIYEVPISYFPRSKKEGKKINWRDGVEALYYLIYYRFFD